MNKTYTKENIVPLNASEIDEILGLISDDILVTNIYSQIEEGLVTSLVRNDILELFDERFRFVVNYYRDYDDVVESCIKIKFDIYKNILERISEKFNFGSNLNHLYDKGDPEYFVYIKALYEFFILDHRKNLITMVYNYILKERTTIIDEYKTRSNTDDLMFTSLSNTFKDDDNIHIIYNIEHIMTDFVNLNIDETEKLINLIIEGDEYLFSNNIIQELILIDSLYNVITDVDFGSILLKPLRLTEYKYTILTDVRNKLIKNFID